MEVLTNVTSQLTAFIHSKSFFYYHGIVLASLWFVGAIIAILLRKVSRQLHALAFFVIDVTSVFFTAGALVRVYPHLSSFSTWSLLKQGHVAAGAIFTLLLVLQHIGGVTTLLKNETYNPSHRKMAFIVSNLGRFLAAFGFIIGQAEQWIIYSSLALAVLLLIASFYKVFINPQGPKNKSSKNPESNSPRQKSPRNTKRQ